MTLLYELLHTNPELPTEHPLALIGVTLAPFSSERPPYT